MQLMQLERAERKYLMRKRLADGEEKAIALGAPGRGGEGMEVEKAASDVKCRKEMGGAAAKGEDEETGRRKDGGAEVDRCRGDGDEGTKEQDSRSVSVK